MHEGHRQRMLEKLKSAEGGLQDHELLEILLFNAIPRQNTNPIAHNLLSSFGGVAGVLRADFDQLKTVEGVGDSTAAYLRIIGLLYDKIDFAKPMDFSSADSLQKYYTHLSRRFYGLTEEVIELYSVDKSGIVKHQMRFTSKEAGRAELDPQDFAKFVASFRPRAVVAAHNHVYGTAQPSAEDDTFTEALFRYCAMYNIKLYDHVIMGVDGYYSYYSNGKL